MRHAVTMDSRLACVTRGKQKGRDVRLLGRMVAVVFAVTIIAGIAPMSHAGQLEDATQALRAGDYVRGMQILRPLAEQGDPRAQYDLEGMYFRGPAVVKDYAAAAKWFLKASEQGLSEAQVMLASMYMGGKGLEKDYVAALMWFEVVSKGEFK